MKKTVKTKRKPGGGTIARRVIFSVLAVIIAVVMGVGNWALDYYNPIIHSFFAGDTATAGSEEGADDAMTAADNAIRAAAEESIVLLKNEKGYLPKKDLEKVNLFGWGSTDKGFILTGGGSGGAAITEEKEYRVDLTDAFVEAGIQYNLGLTEAYSNLYTTDADWRGYKVNTVGAHADESLLNPPASFYTESLLDEAKSFSPVAVVTLSRWGVENGGTQELVNIGKYKNGTFLELTVEEEAMFTALEAKGFEVIVLLNVCNNMELGFLEQYSCIKACLFVGIPGQSGTAAIPKIIKGDVNPSGRTSDTFPYDYQTNNPVYLNAYRESNAIVYQEGIYFGYRWYETADAAGYFADVDNEFGKGYDGVVQFPFGYGLSYTNFTWAVTSFPAPALTQDGEYTVKVKVTNTGDEAGKDVVELYGHAPYTEGGIEKAERVLLSFAKTPLLAPGESCEVELSFTAYDLASYDDYNKGNHGAGYVLEQGDYTLYVMRNSHDTEGAFTIPMSAASAIRYEKDPTTGETVENRFTGETAYMGSPTDGGVTYLSRANKFANFPKERAKPNGKRVSDPRYNGYADVDVSNIKYGENMGIRLVQQVVTDAEGNETYLDATPEMLAGDDTTATLVMNPLVRDPDGLNLTDYDSPFWDALLNQMTQDEVKELIGDGEFFTAPIVSIGKPRCTDKDGPGGFNNSVRNPGYDAPYPVLPSESLLGCSWSDEVAYSIGAAQAAVGAEYGISGWYAPGVNLHRSVYNSRNYEYFSEDALLSGKLATGIVNGTRDGGVYCYVKHFAISEAGDNPKNVDTWINEQALREVYLRAFEIPVKEGKANGIMSAFNCVGAVLSGYNHALLTDILRDEWGFRGTVITDWYDGSGYMSNQTAGVLAGNDLWLAGTTGRPANIDLSKPDVAYAARIAVKNILYTYITTVGTIKVNPAPHSWIVDTLWVSMNVVLGVAFVGCVLGAALPSRKKKGKGRDDGGKKVPAKTSAKGKSAPQNRAGHPSAKKDGAPLKQKPKTAAPGHKPQGTAQRPQGSAKGTPRKKQ